MRPVVDQAVDGDGKGALLALSTYVQGFLREEGVLEGNHVPVPFISQAHWQHYELVPEDVVLFSPVFQRLETISGVVLAEGLGNKSVEHHNLLAQCMVMVMV